MPAEKNRSDKYLNMKNYQSAKHGSVVILDSADQAIECGRAFLNDKVTTFRQNAEAKYGTVKTKRDGKDKAGKTMTGDDLANQYSEYAGLFERAVQELKQGITGMDKGAVQSLAELLREAAVEMEPSLAKEGGLMRMEDGDEFLWELAEAGEERCCLGIAQDAAPIKTKGDGAFRIVINTDVAWWAQPGDNAAVVGALLMVLMEHAACEVWIQQGWLTDSYSGGGLGDASGVTLFKLDFTGAFEPTELAFWIGSNFKDSPFSWAVNKGLGRQYTCVAKDCEVPADLYLCGPWMNADETTRQAMRHAEKIRTADPAEHRRVLLAQATRWIAATAVKLMHPEQEEAMD